MRTPRTTRAIALGLGLALGAAALAACGDDGGDAGASDTTTNDTADAADATEPTVVSASGDISSAVEEYRALLGADNGEDGPQPSGRRELVWDGVPDDLAAPNDLPGDQFRARGALLETPGEAVRVSADADNPDGAAVRFGDLNPSYSEEFVAFSEERLFSPVGSNVVDLTFVVPGTDEPAVVTGFGAVYTDIDTDHTAFEYFDIDGNSLGTYTAPVADQGLSFLGVAFDEPVVARVRISYGTGALGPDDSEDGSATDVAVMDDFIYGEPQPAS